MPNPNEPQLASPGHPAPPPYTKGEEIANSITHGIGAGFSVLGLVVLVVLASKLGDPWKIVSSSIFGASLFILYLSSTLYHSFSGPRIKKALQVLDHSAIFIVIAGSYTPFTLVTLRGAWGWSLFGVVWGLAVGGIVLKIFTTGKLQVLSLTIYIVMGWLAIIAAKPLVTNLEMSGLILVVAGGLAYTAGVVFYVWEKLPYNHMIWHLFVLGGSICHFFAVLTNVILPLE